MTATLLAASAAALALLLGGAAPGPFAPPPAGTVSSPDGRLVAGFRLDDGGSPLYTIRLGGRPVLQESRLGLVRDDADFTRALRLRSAGAVEPVEDHYQILTAKRRVNDYRANRRVFHLETEAGQPLDIVFQVSNDGVAFRYVFPDTSATVHRLKEEVTSFHFLPGTRAWLQPMSVAGTGWGGSNPAYEEFYRKDIPVGTPSPLGAGWVYPALFRSGDTWLLVSEAGLGRHYAGTRLRSESPGGEYTVGFPDPRENRDGGPVDPTSALPWRTPWRLVVVGSLATITESMLGVDLADPPAHPADSTVVPGKAAWSWPLLGDASAVMPVQRRFVDYAADMHWRYCLVDAGWDRQIGYDSIQALVDYARTKNVRILLWYNSAGDWNTTPQTPRDRLLTHEDRVREFARLQRMGVAGIKVDFFGADGQSMIDYYLDILQDAEPYGLLLNFHGATLPRGWERTYPHLMTMEAVKGEEHVTFEQRNADEEPSHATMLPFTRNVFDPMDFTPIVLDKLPRTQRRTTAAFELALSVLFTSGIQHYAEIPAGMATVPEYVRQFLRGVPSVWDDVRFLAGDPGHYVVLARRAGARWYVAGINGDSAALPVTLDLHALAATPHGTLIADGDAGPNSFRQQPLGPEPGGTIRLTLHGHGGFVAVLDE